MGKSLISSAPRDSFVQRLSSFPPAVRPSFEVQHLCSSNPYTTSFIIRCSADRRLSLNYCGRDAGFLIAPNSYI